MHQTADRRHAVDADPWVRITPGHVPGTWFSHCLVTDPGTGMPLLFTQGAGVFQRELWVWDGERFLLDATGVFPGRVWGEDLFGLFAVADHTAQDVLLFGRCRDGVVAARRSEPGTERLLRGNSDRGIQVFAAGWLGSEAHFVAVDGTVLAERSGELVPVADPVGGDVRLRSAVLDPVRERIVASTDDFDGQCWEFDRDGGWRRGLAVGHEGTAVVWHPGERRPWVFGGKGGMRLRPYDEPVSGGPTMPGFSRVPAIAFDASRRQWLLVTSEISPFVADLDGNFRSVPQPLALVHVDGMRPPVDGAVTYEIADGYLRRLSGNEYTSVKFTVRLELGVNGLTAPAPDGGYALDARGALHHVSDNGSVRQLAPPWGELYGLWHGAGYEYSALTGMVFDEVHDRVVLWHGRAAATWSYRNGTWTRVETRAHPPLGEPRLVATPAGVYCQAGGELWLLGGDAGDEWSRVGEVPGDDLRLVFHRRDKPGLWAMTRDGVAVWHDGRFEPVVGLPGQVALQGPAEPGKVVFFDTRSTPVYDQGLDRLVLSGASGTWTLDLADVDHPDLAYPAGEAVVPVPVAPEAVAEQPPGHSFYLLERSIHLAGYEHAHFHVHADVEEVRELLHEEFALGRDDDDFEYLADMVAWGESVVLWTVQRGLLTAGLDLTPFIRVHRTDGTTSGADQPLAGEDDDVDPDEDWDEEDDESIERFSVDWAAIAAALPRLEAPLARPGDDGLTLRFTGPHPQPDLDTYLKFVLDGEELDYGFNEVC